MPNEWVKATERRRALHVFCREESMAQAPSAPCHETLGAVRSCGCCSFSRYVFLFSERSRHQSRFFRRVPMLYRFVFCCLALMSSLCLAPEAVAQSHFPVSIEATAGFRSGHGGTYVNRGGAALDVAIGYRLRDTPAGPLIGALTFGSQTPVVSTDVCLLLPDGGCAPDFPVFFSTGALLGVQRGTARTFSARVLTGPVYYPAAGDGGALGVQGRVDVSTPSWYHTAVVASLRHSLLPSLRAEPVGVTSFGLGLRVQ
jgi:hypothetical protein